MNKAANTEVKIIPIESQSGLVSCHLVERWILKSQHAKCPFLQIQIINQWILIFLAPPQSNLAPLFCVGVRANGKNYNIQKWAYNPSESGKRLKSKPIPSVLGDVGLIKVVLEFSFGHPKCHFSMGTFGKSAHLYVPKNGTSGALINILRPLLKV